MNQATKRAKIRASNKTFEYSKGKPTQNALNTLKPTSGFSLVELLVVVAILAILAAIAIPLFLNQRSKAAQGTVQSDARNLATNLNTLFTNLPRSADPNVALNGSTAPNTTLSGSGTIEVGGETLNVNLSPDVVITKTGNANPAVGAGLKITHAGVENWACVIPLPSSVAYAQTVTFQPACGTVVSENGNLLTANQASVESGTTTGFRILDNTSSLTASTEQVRNGYYSLKTVATNAGESRANMEFGVPSSVVPGQSYTFSFYAQSDQVSGERASAIISWFSPTSVYLGASTGDAMFLSNTDWTLAQVTGAAPAGAGWARLDIARSAGIAGAVTYYDCFGFWQGAGGLWAPPGVPIVE